MTEFTRNRTAYSFPASAAARAPSVRAIARKYGGEARFEARENVFMSSVYVVMGESEEE